MATYRKADKEAFDIGRVLIEAGHKELEEAGVKVNFLFAFAERDKESAAPKGAALKWHGAPAVSVVKITSHKDRVAGLADVVIALDGDAWPNWSEERRKAIIDHCLCELQVKRDEYGAIALDDSCRPKLKRTLYDFSVCGYDVVVKRWGDSSIEFEAAIDLNRRLSQMEFAFR